MFWRSRYRPTPSDRGAPSSVTLCPAALSALLQCRSTSSVELRNVHISAKGGLSEGTGCLEGEKRTNKIIAWSCKFTLQTVISTDKIN